MGTIIDITARKLAQLAMEESERTLRLISELTSDYVYIGDRTEHLSNPPVIPRVIAGSFERIVGFTPAEVKARGGWFALVHPDDVPKTHQINGALQNGQPLVAEYRIVDRRARRAGGSRAVRAGD